MKNVYGRFWYGCAVVALLAPSTAVQAATISLKAVKVNGVPITPTNELTALPGDVIYAELYASDWSPAGEECKTWQVAVDTCNFFSGPCGMVVPLGWDRPAECVPIFCDPDGPNTCPDDLECHMPGMCAGPDHDSWAGIFIDIERPDYIFYGHSGISECDLVQYRCGGMVWADPYPAYEPPPKYLGTLILVASNDACGEFVIDFVVGVGWDTMLLDEQLQLILPLTLEPLTITFGEPPPRLLISCNGTESGGQGATRYEYVLLNNTPGPMPIGTFCVGTNDLDPTHYSSWVAPSGFIPTATVANVDTTPCSVMYTSYVKTPHGVTPPGEAMPPLSGAIFWSGNHTIPAGQTVVFGFENPMASWDAEWTMNAPDGSLIQVGQSDQPLTGPGGNFGTGWVHSPSTEEKDGDGDGIPAASQWGLIVLALVLLAGAKVYFGRRRAAAA